MLDPVNLDIDKDEFLTSKFNNKKYKAFGSFSKHLQANGYDLESYTLKYFKDKIPICIESGETSDYKVVGHWNRWMPIKRKYKNLIKLTKLYEGKLQRVIEKNLFSEYLSIDYWDNKPKYSEKIIFLNWLIDKKWYIRLHDSYYDETWTEVGKEIYKDSILNGVPQKLKGSNMLEGLLQRGHTIDTASALLTQIISKRKPNKRTFAGMLLEGHPPEEIPDLLKEYYKNKPCSFRNPENQKKNVAKKLAKYSKDELKAFSVRCKEYWLAKGYNLDEAICKVKAYQDLNSIQSIMQRLSCTELEAIDIQSEIYSKRAITMSLKPESDLKDMYRRQDSGSFEYCLRKCNYDRDFANILYGELIRKRIVPFGKASKESLKYFMPLYKVLRRNGIRREDIYFGVNGSNEYGIFSHDGINKYRFYDFTILSKRLIIEYDGAYWHSTAVADTNDKFKDNLAKINGFKLLRISSTDDLRTNKLKIENFINENISINFADW